MEVIIIICFFLIFLSLEIASLLLESDNQNFITEISLFIFTTLLSMLLTILVMSLIQIVITNPNEQETITINNEVQASIIEPIKANAKTNENVTKEKDSNKYVSIEVCNSSSVKTYMDYRAITNKSSKQYRYIEEHITVADGFLWQGEYIGVALGSYFGEIGSKYIFTLDTGIELKVVKVEAKADKHTYNGCQQRWDGSVLEFVVNTDYFKKEANGYVKFGNFNNDEAFRGKIERIYKVE